MSASAAPPWLAEAVRLRSSGLTYQQLADRLGVSKSSVHHWLNRERHNEQARAWKQRHGYRPPARQTTGRKTTSTRHRNMKDMQRISEVRLTVRLTEAERAALAAAAERDHRSISSALRVAAERYAQEVRSSGGFVPRSADR